MCWSHVCTLSTLQSWVIGHMAYHHMVSSPHGRLTYHTISVTVTFSLTITRTLYTHPLAPTRISHPSFNLRIICVTNVYGLLLKACYYRTCVTAVYTYRRFNMPCLTAPSCHSIAVIGTYYYHMSVMVT